MYREDRRCHRRLLASDAPLLRASQVNGCQADLSVLKHYHQRYKVHSHHAADALLFTRQKARRTPARDAARQNFALLLI